MELLHEQELGEREQEQGELVLDELEQELGEQQEQGELVLPCGQ
jgi:hypothetical protein